MAKVDTKQLNVEVQFNLYMEMVGLKDRLPKTSPQYREMKRTFFGATGMLLVLFRDVLAELDENRAVLHLEDMNIQCEQFWKEQLKNYS